jgi:hypothetical protein
MSICVHAGKSALTFSSVILFCFRGDDIILVVVLPITAIASILLEKSTQLLTNLPHVFIADKSIVSIQYAQALFLYEYCNVMPRFNGLAMNHIWFILNHHAV